MQNSLLSRIRPAALAALVLLAGLAAAWPASAQPLLDSAGLRSRLTDPALIILDIRTGETREKGRVLFEAGHIPGAVHADYAHASWRLPRGTTSVYLPEPAQFEALAGDLGIGNESHVVIVHEGNDASSFSAAARIYWSFKVMGHQAVSILDGGYQAWMAEAAGIIEQGPAKITPAIYEARPNPALRASLADVLAAQAGAAMLIDSRPASFYAGLEKHKAVESFGHIAGARNIPHASAVRPDFKMKSKAELEQAFAAIPGDSGAIAYCNTGHWGASGWFVLSEILGRKNVKLYDGSMLEYASEKRGSVSTKSANGT